MKQWICTCELLESGLSGLFLNYLQTWAFLGSGSGVSSAWDVEKKLKQLLFWSKIVIKLYTSSFLRELCAFITGLGPSFASKVKSTWKLASPEKLSHFSSRDSSAQGCQSVPLGASFPGNLPLYS